MHHDRRPKGPFFTLNPQYQPPQSQPIQALAPQSLVTRSLAAQSLAAQSLAAQSLASSDAASPDQIPDPIRADRRFGTAYRRRLIAETPPQSAGRDPQIGETRAAWNRAILRQALVLIALVGLAVLLRDRLIALDMPAILAHFNTVTAPQWALALLATAVSYWSLGHYDAVIHRALNTGMSDRAATRAGAAAIAISQTVGFGLVSGALVRWRLSPGLSLAQASKITAITAASFLIGWAAVTGLALLTLPISLPTLSLARLSLADTFSPAPSAFGGFGAQALGALGIGIGLTALTLSLAKPQLTLLGRRITLPSTALMLRIGALAALDTIAAAAALWALLPPGTGPEFATLLPAFLLALGAGFISGTPGGIGPFEVTLLALLPGLDQNPADQTALLAAILAWRGAYFALPAAIAGLAIVTGLLTEKRGKDTAAAPQNQPVSTARPHDRDHQLDRDHQRAALECDQRSPTPRHSDAPEAASAKPNARTGFPRTAAQDALAPPATELTPRLQALVERAQRAELGLLRQGEHSVLLAGNARAGWMIGQARQTLVGLLDPFGAPSSGLTAALLPRLTELARAQGRIPCLYKINARTAAAARKLGWTVAPVAREAWLAPQSFDLDTPARSSLRRKLRKAQKSGVRISCAEGALPIDDMTAISEAWVQERGPERGFSMGRYTPEYASAQRVYLAHKGEDLVGFASFHEGGKEWVLDLMRPAATAPDGTMHALIAAAITDAKAFAIPRLSLAALPPEADQTSGPASVIWKRAEAAAGAAGLKQFKSAFAPEWQTLYIAARGPARLTLAAADIAHAIHRPPAPLRRGEPAKSAARGKADRPTAALAAFPRRSRRNFPRNFLGQRFVKTLARKIAGLRLARQNGTGR